MTNGALDAVQVGGCHLIVHEARLSILNLSDHAKAGVEFTVLQGSKDEN